MIIRFLVDFGADFNQRAENKEGVQMNLYDKTAGNVVVFLLDISLTSKSFQQGPGECTAGSPRRGSFSTAIKSGSLNMRGCVMFRQNQNDTCL